MVSYADITNDKGVSKKVKLISNSQHIKLLILKTKRQPRLPFYITF